MVNYIPINCSDENRESSDKLKAAFEGLFKYTNKVNVHVVFDFTSPIDCLGKYKYLVFIDIPYEQGNYYRSLSSGIYLNSLAFALKDYEDNSVVNITDSELVNKDGTWDYRQAIEDERAGLVRFALEHIPNLKFFNIAVLHRLKSSGYGVSSLKGNLACNYQMRIWEIVDFALRQTANNNGKGCDCFAWNGERGKSWSVFISSFLGESEKRTRQGILTINKINEISKEKISKPVAQALQSAGKRLTIVRGKAGTGKSLTLLKVMYNKVRKDEEKRNHRCRFLTYNNVLVMDIKQLLKGMGNDFNQSSASVSTLHRYFQSIYKNSPVRALHMNQMEIDRLFNLCRERVAKMVALISLYKDEAGSVDIEAPQILSYWVSKGKVDKSDYKECEQFCKYLYRCNRYVNFSNVEEIADEYQKDKKRRFDEFFSQKEFLNDYNRILQELYLLFHNQEEFIKQFGVDVVYPDTVIREDPEFIEKNAELYQKFIKDTKQSFAQEHNLESVGDVNIYFAEESKILQEIRASKLLQSEAAISEDLKKQCKKILGKVRWSDLIIVDEAQDCTPYEKALLIEMHGSDKIVIASGGKDQLIRTSFETDWKVQFGTPLETETVTLSYVHRSKPNIVSFINEYAKQFNLNTSLALSESERNVGNVIVDARSGVGSNTIPVDIVERLHISGADHGCSDYENELFLLPKLGFIGYTKSHMEDVTIDANDTILFKPTSSDRSLNTTFPDYIETLDCTINRKSSLFDEVGHNRTRCLLYESCRGIEAWNVFCINLDKFYESQFQSDDASVYAENAAGLFSDEDTLNKYRHQFASLWVLMAITRAIDTLYIRLDNLSSTFSQRLIKMVKNLQGVELLTGEYSGN